MPRVESQSIDEPAKLERYEFPPGSGNLIKLTAADYNARMRRLEEDEAYQRAYAAGPAPDAAPAASVVPLTILTKAELVALAEARELKATGTKDAIAARFVAGNEPDEEPSEDPEQS